MSKILTAVILALLLSPLSQASGETAELDLKKLIKEAIENNPKLKAIKKHALAFKHKVPQAGALEDPQLKAGIDNLPIKDPSFTEFLPTSKVIGLSQKIPFPGKLSLKERMALKEADSAEALYKKEQNKIREEIKSAYYDLYYINKAIAINKKNKKLLHDLSKVAATRYSVGKGIQQDVLKAQVELSKIVNELIVLKQKKVSAKARINTILDRPTNSKLPDPPDVKIDPFPYTLKELQQSALKHSYLLKALKKEIEKNEVGVSLAKREFLPDFNFSLVYKQREDGDNFSGDDWISGFVSMTIPLYLTKKQVPHLKERKATLMQAKSIYRQARNDLSFKVKDTFVEIKKEQKLIKLFETGFIPQARQSLDSALSGYQVDKVDFLTLTDNLLSLLRFELEYYKTITNYEKLLSQMESLIDKPLTSYY
ncbi:MAG: TolC family protein [Candidatus Dadabacteria bacterium]|nr:MAG: TolC family protein [Candidatus Dadabacteria bacterium]